jgi:lipopolysaccharide/colanic/teichoic acid biosynthesis glycosyltransferase
LAITVLVALNNPSVKVVVKRYFDMFLRFVVLFVFIIAVGLILVTSPM